MIGDVKKILKSFPHLHVLIVEDQFTKVENHSRFSYYLLTLFSNGLYKSLVDDLKKFKVEEKIINSLTTFEEKISAFENDKVTLLNTIVEEPNFRIDQDLTFVKKHINQLDIVEDIDKVTALIKDMDIDFFEYISLKYGLIETRVNDYQELFEFFDEIKMIPMIIQDIKALYRDDIYDYIAKIKNGTLFAIIDKRLGNGDKEGYVVAEEIRTQCKVNSVICLDTMYSSYGPDGDSDQDINEIVIRKSTPLPWQQILEKIAFNACDSIFDLLFETTTKALDKAKDLAQGKKYIIEAVVKSSTKEGGIVFEAIENWFNVASNYYKDEDLKEKFDLFRYGFLINSDYFTVKPEIGRSEELNNIQSSEIYDYSINWKHVPIGPGDIFYKSKTNEYFVLFGQECDLALRSDNTRKYKTVEFIKLQLSAIENCEHKAVTNINNGNRSVIYQHFKDIEGSQKCLNAILNDHHLGSFNIIDLCMFDTNGFCKINLSKPLNESIQKLFPDNIVEYYSGLQRNYSDIFQQKDFADKISQFKFVFPDFLVGLHDESTFTFDESSDELTFGFQRICRIRERFWEILDRAKLDHLGRIGLFEPQLYNDVFVGKYLIKSPTLNGGKEEINDIQLRKHTDQIHLTTKDFIKYIPKAFISIFTDETIILETIEQSNFEVKMNKNQVEFTFPLKDLNGNSYTGSSIPIKNLMGDDGWIINDGSNSKQIIVKNLLKDSVQIINGNHVKNINYDESKHMIIVSDYVQEE